MKNALYGLLPAWRAELLKFKGSYLRWLILLLGAAAPILFVTIAIFEQDGSVRPETERLPFNYFTAQLKQLIPAYGFFLFPLTIVISTTRICGVEYKTDTWKLMETQPVSRLSIWLVKWGMTALTALLAVAVFLLSSVLCFSLLALLQAPHKAADMLPPVAFIAAIGLRLWLAGLGIIIVQLVLSMLLRSNTWPVVIGVVALIVTNIAANDNSTLSSFWPYALPNYTARYPEGSEAGYLLLPSEWQGMLWLLVAPLGYLLYVYRGAFWQSFRNKSIWLAALGGLLVFTVGSWWVQTPKTMPLLAGRTVVVGSIKAQQLPDSVEVLSLPVYMPLRKVAVQQDGSFHMNIDLSGDAEELVVRLDNLFAERIYAGEGDSIFLNWRLGNAPGMQEVKLSGSALATNRYLSERQESWSSVRYLLSVPMNLPEPEFFFKQLHDEWKKKVKRPGAFRTADGMGLSSRMQELQEKLITVEYLNMALYEYPSKKSFNRNDPAFAAATNRLRPLLERIQPFEPGLVGWSQYHNYLYNSLTGNLAAGQNKDSVYYNALLQQSAGKLQDRLLYDFATKQLEASRDSVSRAAILLSAAVIGDERLKQKLNEKGAVMNRIRRGQPAPALVAHTAANEPTGFAALKGKYIVVDVWATWCAPCKEESPIFERLAEKYKDAPVRFVALSIDDNRQAWERQVQNKRLPVLQWRVQDNNQFAALYGVTSIPRFLLLDVDGRFVNALMPRPSDPNFEKLLRQALQLQEEEG